MSDGPYRVVPVGEQWGVVDTSDATGLPSTYETEVAAVEWADLLNKVYDPLGG